jgi:hypothetical protein
MKKIVLIASLSCILTANSLENFLLKEDENINIGEKENIEYYVIRKTNKDTVISGNFSSKDGKGWEQGSKHFNTMKHNIYNYSNDLEKERKEKINPKSLEELIYKYLEIPESIKKHELKEKVVISFVIDKKNNISNIQFIKPSSYEDINKELENAIIKSSIDFETPKSKETKTVYFRFNI